MTKIEDFLEKHEFKDETDDVWGVLIEVCKYIVRDANAKRTTVGELIGD